VMNTVIDCLMNHRSIRKFKSRSIEPEKLDLILRAGVRAATAGNLQHYSLIVVDDVEKKRALNDDPLVENSTMIVAVVDIYRLKRWFESNGAPFYFNQVCNLLIGFWDAIVALQNVVIAAESLGLGTVYLGEVLSRDLAQILGTPKCVFPAGLVAVGYPDETPDLRPRLPLEAVAHRNSYHVPSDDEMMAFYREKDQAWESLPEESRRDLLARNIRNTAQRVTVGHYTEEFITGESKAILENLKKAGFKLTLD